MENLFRLLILLFLAAIFQMATTGCSKGNSPCVYPGSIITNKTSESYIKLSDDSVIATIADRVLTKGDIEKKVKIIEKSIISQYENINEARMVIDRNKENFPSLIVGDFLRSSAFELECSQRGIEPSDTDFQQAWLSVTGGLADVSVQASSLTNEVYLRARNSSLFRALFTNSLDVTEREVEVLHEKLVNANSVAAATNKLIRARMSALRQDLVSGKVDIGVDDEDECEKSLPEGFQFESFDDSPRASFVDDEIIPDELKKVKVDEWTALIELDDTYELYKLTKISAKTNNVPTLYSGIRIYAEKDLGVVIPTKEQLRTDIYQRKNVQKVWPVVEGLLKKYGTCYPHGLIWEVASKEIRRQK